MSQKLFGDIIVCVDEAVAQAKRYRATWQAELSRYIVHGVLHLLGYDDSTAVARQRMRRQENRLMKTVSVRHSLGKSIRAGLRNRER
jgi:probable rRNA maturation factor